MASQSQQHTTVEFGDPVANDDSQNNLSFIDSHGVNSSDITSGRPKLIINRLKLVGLVVVKSYC